MSRSITKRQEQARELRMQKMSLREIGEKLGISKQGALYLIIAGDKYSDIQISTLKKYKEFLKNAGKQSAERDQENSPERIAAEN